MLFQKSRFLNNRFTIKEDLRKDYQIIHKTNETSIHLIHKQFGYQQTMFESSNDISRGRSS